jgi:hypothetical protein
MKRLNCSILIVIVIILSIINICQYKGYHEHFRQSGTLNMNLVFELDNYYFRLIHYLENDDISINDLELLNEITISYKKLFKESGMNRLYVDDLFLLQNILTTTIDKGYINDEVKEQIIQLIKDISDNYILSGDYKAYLNKNISGIWR